MICVTTRFRLRHFWTLLPMYLTYRRMRHDLDEAPGLIRHAFLVQSPVSCCTLSIWESRDAVIAFSNVPRHVHAVRRSKRWCRDIWSAYWRIDAISAFANRWQGRGRGQWPVQETPAGFPWHREERPLEEVQRP
jgi:hypothetical protein